MPTTLSPGQTVALSSPIEKGNIYELYLAPTKDDVFLDEAGMDGYTARLTLLSPTRKEIENDEIIIEKGDWEIGDVTTSLRVTMSKEATAVPHRKLTQFYSPISAISLHGLLGADDAPSSPPSASAKR